MLRFVSILALTMLAASGCEPDDVEPDVAESDIEEDVGDLPDFDVSIEASRLSGNVPLDVAFTAVVTGIDPDELTLEWFYNDVYQATGPAWSNPFRFPGQITITLKASYRRASDGATKVDSTSVIVNARACADLTFGSFSITPSDLPPGGTLTVGVGTLYNEADSIADPFTVALGLSTDALWDPASDILIPGPTITEMASGFQSEVARSLIGQTFVLPADLPEGEYFVFLVADPGGVVNECDEANNQKASTNSLSVDVDAGKRANLRFELLGVAASEVQQGASVPYELKIRNDGDAEARNFRYALWLSSDQQLDRDSDIPWVPAADAKVTVAAAQSTVPVNRARPMPDGLADGDYWVIGEVDTAQTVTESNEADNIAVSANQLTMKFVRPDCADLAVTRVVVSPLVTYWGGSVSMQVTVENPGTKPIPDGWLFRAYLSPQPSINPSDAFVVGTYTMPEGVPAGEERTFDLILQIPSGFPVSRQWIAGIADPTQSITECNEGNNSKVFGESIDVKAQAQIDVAVQSFDFHPDEVEAGETIKVEYQLANLGTAAATSFQVAVVLSPDAVISREGIAAGIDVVIAKETITSIQAGVTLEPRTIDPVVPTGLDHAIETYRVALLADVDGFLTADTNITNNLKYSDTPLVVTGATGGCLEDLGEPDDVRADATLVDASTPVVMNGLGNCGDSDWFEVVVPQGHSLLVDVDARTIVAVPPVTANLVVELVDPSGAVAQRATFGPHYEVRAFAVPAIGTWAVRVSGATATDRAAYDIALRTQPPRVGIDVVGFDAQPAPAVSYPGGRVAITWREVNLGTVAAVARTTRIWLSKDRVKDATDLALGEQAVPALAPGETRALDAVVSVPSNVPGGSWYLLVEVDADGDLVEADESNNLTPGGPITLDPLKVCNDDDREPNDEQGIATLLDDGDRVADAVVCPGLDDWYAVDLEVGDAFEAEVAYPYDPSKGKMVLELWDPDGQAALLVDSRTSSLRVSLPSAWTPGRWLVRVANEAGPLTAPYTYDLTVTVSQGPIASFCEGDRYEPNNVLAGAVGMGCGLVEATLCMLDTDWYVIQGKAGQKIDFTLTNAKYELQGRIYLPGGTSQVASLYGYSPTTTGSYTPVASGPLFVRIDPKSPSTLSAFDYTLKATGLDGADLALTELSSPFDAVERGEDAGVHYTVRNQCTAASAAFDVSAFLSIDDELGTDDVEVGTWSVDSLAAAASATRDPKFTVPFSTMPGLYWIVVQADSGAVVPEGNEIDNVLATPLEVREPCTTDDLEPNDDRGAASDVTLPGQVTQLSICPSDQDWFAVDAAAGDRVRIDVLFEQADGDLDLRVYAGQSSAPVATSQSTDDDESVVIDVPIATTLYVRIAGYADASAPYELYVTRE